MASWPAARAPTRVLDLLPTLSRGELLNVAFRVAGLTGPLIEAPQELLLQTKARMQQVLRDRPLAEWGEALAPFVAEAKRQGFSGSAGGPVAEGLDLLFNFPKHGFTKTRNLRLDPPVRVTGVFKKRFGLALLARALAREAAEGLGTLLLRRHCREGRRGR